MKQGYSFDKSQMRILFITDHRFRQRLAGGIFGLYDLKGRRSAGCQLPFRVQPIGSTPGNSK